MNGDLPAAALVFGLDPILVLGYGLLSLWPLYALVLLGRWLKRRAALREFAASHHLRFRGILPSDKYAPYTAFEIVRQAVLLFIAMEGRWNECDVAAFDYRRRRGVSAFGVIVSLPHDGSCFRIDSAAFSPGSARSRTDTTLAACGLDSWVVNSELIPGEAARAIGPRTAARLRLRDGSPVSLETNLGYLLVTQRPPVGLDDVPDVLEFATSVARAIELDAARRHDDRVIR